MNSERVERSSSSLRNTTDKQGMYNVFTATRPAFISQQTHELRRQVCQLDLEYFLDPNHRFPLNMVDKENGVIGLVGLLSRMD